jgi:hypothetical protein
MLVAVLAAAGDVTALPVVAAMAMGFVIALVGHIAHNRFVVGCGIAVLFLATGAMVVSGMSAYSEATPDPKCTSTPGAFRAC